jgi:hypothetical protein
MEPKHHPETSVTNFPLKLGNSLGDQNSRNTSTSNIYLFTKFNILNFHWYISSGGQAANETWMSCSCQITLFHYTKRILNKSSIFVANPLQHAITGLHVMWPSCVSKLSRSVKLWWPISSITSIDCFLQKLKRKTHTHTHIQHEDVIKATLLSSEK